MKITINGKVKNISKPAKILDLFDNSEHKYYAAYVNNRLRELNFEIRDDSKIELLDLSNDDVHRIYERSLRYVVVMAVKELYPNSKISFDYTVSRNVYAELNNLDHPFLHKDLNKIKAKIKDIINADMPIERITLSKKDAIKYYKDNGWDDKVNILKYRPENICHLYKCGDYMNYMYSYMLPSTGYLNLHAFRLYSPGFLIYYPRAELNGKIPKFQDENTFRNTLKEQARWSDSQHINFISQMNKIIIDGGALELINVAEARHNRQLCEIGQKIEDNINRIKMICVAGPSSSGKTTFTNRLRIELKARGIEPLMISMDNFYLSKTLKSFPKDENGKNDLEHVDALDLKLFDELLYKLIQGQPVKLPIYDFKTDKRDFTEPVILKENQPIIIEGIHGLNPKIAPSIPDSEKFKIFIAPLIQYKIDNENPIPIADVRLIRRMVRDYLFRGASAELTLSSWASVRKGEYRWIYPYCDSADYVFNSELSYELFVMKKYGLHILEDIKQNSKYFMKANGLIKFLKYFNSITDKWIPCNSILKEFLGGSIFYTTDKK